MNYKVKINAIDLDKTLIQYDSFRELIINEVKRFNMYIIYMTILRVLRVLPATKYKEKTSLHFVNKYSEKYFINYANKLYKDIDQRVFDIIKLNTDDNTKNVLISASPNFYVQYLIQKLNWLGSGSYFSDAGKYIHLFEKEKMNWLKKEFKQDTFEYNFAISDSSSDDELLSLFKKKEKWKL